MNAHEPDSDNVTGALNRRAFDERFEAAVVAAQPFAVCLVDLDRFQVINDAHGHEAGNAVLKEVAHRLLEALWTDDAIGRFGGDEFAVLLAGADEERSYGAAGKMRRVVSQPMEVAGATVTPDVSIAVALHLHDGEPADVLIQRADQDLERVKTERRDSTETTE